MPRMKFAVLALLPVASACQTPEAMPAVASVSVSSLCQIDRPMSYAVAPVADANDTGNKFDTDETVKNLMAHNARLKAACDAD